MMQLICGPAHDRREINLELPAALKIGVLTSGGIDSTLLYYLTLYLKYTNNTNHSIYPIMIMRKEGSRYFARSAVQKINAIWNYSRDAMRLGDTSLPEPEQVGSAVKQAFDIFKMYYVYIGVITNRPEHMIGFDPIPVPETPGVLVPFKHLEKSHVIDMYYQLGIQDLLKYTHSCDQHEQLPCGACNGCRERAWGFAELGHADPIMQS
jgi:hypothetical protein